MDTFLLNFLGVIVISATVGLFCFVRGYKKGNKESEGVSARVLDTKCVYRLFHKIQFKKGSLLLVLKEKSPDRIERGRFKILETSLLDIRNEFLRDYSFFGLPEYFSYTEQEHNDYCPDVFLIFKKIGEIEYKEFGG